MISLPWYSFALGAAMMWGLAYVLAEELIQKRGVPPSFLIFIEAFVAIPLYIVLVSVVGGFKEGIVAMFSQKSTAIMLLLLGFLVMLGNYFIVQSVSSKNATMTSFIEISYPLFTILFVWLFLGKFDLNLYTLAGAILIMTGVGVMILKG
jgi:DME family drug/metabolite transporter